jgi:hypothetical protein
MFSDDYLTQCTIYRHLSRQQQLGLLRHFTGKQDATLIHPSQIDFASPIGPKHRFQVKVLRNSSVYMHKLFLALYHEYFTYWHLFLDDQKIDRKTPLPDTKTQTLLTRFHDYRGNVAANFDKVLKITRGTVLDNQVYLKYMLSGHMLRSRLCDKTHGKSKSCVFITIPLPIDLPNLPVNNSRGMRFVCIVDHFFTAKYKDMREVHQYCRLFSVYKPIIEKDPKTRFWLLKDETYALDKEFIIPVEYIYSHVFLIKVHNRPNMLYALPTKDML